jgi:hypothetical protein
LPSNPTFICLLHSELSARFQIKHQYHIAKSPPDKHLGIWGFGCIG